MAVPVNSATSGVGYGVQNGVRFCAHRHARGHHNSPPDCCYPDGLPCSSLSIIAEQKKQGKSLAFFIGADYETYPVRFCAHRHARGHRNSPPDCCYPDGLPCSSLSIIVEQKKQGKKPCFLYWSGLRDSPGALLRAPARTRAPQQSPGLLLPWRVALFESRAKILRTKKHKAKCLVLFVGADYETRTRYLHLGKVALYQMS